MTDDELNRLVAEKVMGWHCWVDWETNDYDGPLPMFRPGLSIGVDVYTSHGDPEKTLWSPATSIADAWEVVSALPGGFSLESPAVSASGFWEATFYQNREEFLALGVAPPQAICLASLQAKGINLEETE